MLVDEVREILEISNENIQPAPDFGTDIRTEFIHAMGRVGGVTLLFCWRLTVYYQLKNCHN